MKTTVYIERIVNHLPTRNKYIEIFRSTYMIDGCRDNRVRGSGGTGVKYYETLNSAKCAARHYHYRKRLEGFETGSTIYKGGD